MSELDKLEKYLLAHGYEYNRIEEDEVVFGRHQIIVYRDGKRLWDAICQRGSYGYEHGLLEIYGNIVQESDGDGVVGWLTAKDVIRRIEINLGKEVEDLVSLLWKGLEEKDLREDKEE